MKWWRIRRLANAGAWSLMLVGAGMIGGLLLSTALVGIPRAEHLPILGPYSIEYLDLATQRSMSDAAWFMAFVAIVSTMVGAFGLVLLARTLQETRSGALAALQGARASEIAVRPFLLVEFASASIKGGTLRIDYKVKNSGVSPAYNVAFRVTLLTKAIDGDTAREASSTKSRSDIAAGVVKEAFAEFDPYLAAEVSDDRGTFELEIHITLIYQDAFKVRHEETSKYGRYLSYYDLGTNVHLYRDVGGIIRWGD
ncbi:hypothetical protein [Devosia naphthalenivorans]|uniref:hypothetical protein n=1 Tax=Devosia naphthalenivorans TaxID=2082392 RepID=UPI000D3A1CA5|nr:hypothetical protein [Devosia naphthalenivorans]